MNLYKKNKLVVLISIDGWGISLNTENNAIRKAQINGFKNLILNFPATVISMPGLSDSENYTLIGSGQKNLENDISSHLSISKTISQANLSQLKVSSSNDFPLISVFFNNSDDRLLGEDWIILDNKKNIFSSLLNENFLVKNLIKFIKSNCYNFIFSSLSDISSEIFKGDFLNTVLAVEKVSDYLEKISKAVLDVDGVLIITSTYGGAEDVYNIGTGLPNKKRTNNPVPFLIIGRDYQGRTIGLEEAPNNDLSLLNPKRSYIDIAPTILEILGLPIPSGMIGKSFLSVD